jgi:hypothetical protein
VNSFGTGWAIAAVACKNFRSLVRALDRVFRQFGSVSSFLPFPFGVCGYFLRVNSLSGNVVKRWNLIISGSGNTTT